MANRYANLVGSNKIKDEYTKINAGFDAVQAEMDAVNAELDAHKADTVAHVTQAEHDKLAGIEPGAQVNQNAFSWVNDVQATTEEDALTVEGGTGITITTDPAQKRLIITATGEATPGPHATSHITGGTDVIPDAVPGGNSGLMSGADKAKLDKVVSDVGDMSTVPTTSKVVAGAISELFTSVSDGKSAIAAAITDKGVPTSPTDTFATMAANIGAIETGGPWFGDWEAYIPMYDWSGTELIVPPNSWYTVVDVNGKGYFKWCRATSGSSFPRIRLTIDGAQYLFDVNGNNVNLRVNEVNMEIPFNTSLKIEVFNAHTSSATKILDYLYYIQINNPNPRTNTILEQSTRMNYNVSVVSTTLVDAVNITGSGYLHAIRFSGRKSASGTLTVYGDISIDGVPKMTDSAVFDDSVGGYAKRANFMGPIRFETSLRVRTRTNNANDNAFCFIEYSLD